MKHSCKNYIKEYGNPPESSFKKAGLPIISFARQAYYFVKETPYPPFCKGGIGGIFKVS
jgi:hypothetical protein